MIETIEWIEVKFAEPTEEEIEAWAKKEPDISLCYMMDCPIPEDGEEILIQTKHGVSVDTCGYNYGYYLEGHGSWEDVIAWARMPKGIRAKEK